MFLSLLSQHRVSKMGGELLLTDLVRPPNLDIFKSFKSEFDSDAYILSSGKKRNRPNAPIVLASYSEYLGRMNEVLYMSFYVSYVILPLLLLQNSYLDLYFIIILFYLLCKKQKQNI